MVYFKRVGKLTQAAEELPFRPKRVYWIDTKGEARGGHAHYKTKQVFTCIKGNYTLVTNDGKMVSKYELNENAPVGILVTKEWHTMENCSPDCIILIMADRFYDENDYIRDFATWKDTTMKDEEWRKTVHATT